MQPGIGVKALRSTQATGRPRTLTAAQEHQALCWINGRDWRFDRYREPGGHAQRRLSVRVRLKSILLWIYLGRAVTLALYLIAQKTALTFYAFSIVLGLLWLANVPATAGLIGKLFGTRYLSTLFGFAMLSHQIGAFFCAWLGGYAVTRFGDYS